MRRLFAIAVLGVTGCSNAPLAGFLDAVAPCKAPVPERGDGRPTRITLPPGDAIPPRPRDTTGLPPAADFVPPVGPRN